MVVNAAATDVPGPVADLAIDAWDRVLDVNLRAPFVLAKAVFPHMRRVGSGTIINVSSVAGKRAWANASAYCASKFRSERADAGACGGGQAPDRRLLTFLR